MNKRLHAIAVALVLLCVSGGLVFATGGAESGSTQSDQVQTISYYGFSEWVGDPKVGPYYQELANEFAEQNPGYEVELLHDPWGTWHPKYKTLFASGNAPDVMIVNNPDFPVFANGDHLLDLGAAIGEEAFADFFPGVLSMYTWKGRKMAFPFTTDARVLWYNVDMFERAGLDPDDPPQTWDELLAYAEQLTMDTNDDGRVDVYGFGADYGLASTPQKTIFVASEGSFVTVADDGTITPNVRTPEVRAWLELIVDMRPYYQADFATLDHQQVSTLFAQEKVAMITAGFWPWAVNDGLEQQDFYRHALIPRMNESAPNGSFGGGFGISVAKDSDHPDQAVAFAQMMVAPENNALLMTDIPASEAGLASSDYTDDPKYSVFLEQIEYARQHMPKTLDFSEIDVAIHGVGMQAVLGRYTIDEAIEEMESAIIDIVD